MPFDLSKLPPVPTPDQVTAFVQEAASNVIETITNETANAQNKVEGTFDQSLTDFNKAVEEVNKTTQVAITQLRRQTDLAKQEMQSAGDLAVREFQSLINEVLRLVGHIPSPADLAIGDVNGEVFFEPLGCFLLFIKAVAENKNPIKVRLHEPTVIQAFRDLVGSTQDEIARKAQEKVMARISSVPLPSTGEISLPLPTSGINLPLPTKSGTNYSVNKVVEPASGTAATVAAILSAVPTPVWIILAVGTVILASAVSIFVILMGVAIIYALYKDYNIKDLSLKFDSPLVGTSINVTIEK